MKEIPLKKFCESHTQAKAAEIMGRSQGAVSQMLKSKRKVFITIDAKGRYGWYEIRPGRKNGGP